jgi:hypothetical protein
VGLLHRRSAAAVAGVCGALAAALLAGAAAAGAVSEGAGPADAGSPMVWAAAEQAALRPGMLLVTGRSYCTGNFVFTDAERHVYLGQAAHCSASGNANALDGCKDKSLPLGTKVAALGANVRGTLAYNSWLAMQEAGERDRSTCRNNDFALVRLPDDVRTQVNPSVPYFGGPFGINSASCVLGDAIFSYGNSPLRANMSVLAPKRGVSLGTFEDGWTHVVAFATPGVPGDSGSAVLDRDGKALGVMSSLNIYPGPGSNGVSDIGRMLSYAKKHSGIRGLRLADGTEAFAG